MIGLKGGETKGFTIKYPKTHEPKELAGKDVEYVVTIKEVQAPSLPKIDEDFAKSLGVADGDLKKMNEEIKQSLEQEVERRIKANLKQQVFTSLVESHTFDLPKALVGAEINRLGQTTYQNLQKQGMDPKDIKLEPAMFEENAKIACKLRIILGSIVDTHTLQATPDQIKAKVEEFSSIMMIQRKQLNGFMRMRRGSMSQDHWPLKTTWLAGLPINVKKIQKK